MHIDITQQRKQLFVIEKLDGYVSRFETDYDKINSAVFGQKSYTLQINQAKLKDSEERREDEDNRDEEGEEEELVHVEFK